MSSSLWSESPVAHIQDLSVEILSRASSLSKRGKDAFRALYSQCGEDVATLAYTLMAPDFSWADYHPGIGGITLEELTAFSASILELVRRCKDAPGLEQWDIYEKKFRLSRYGIAPDRADELLQAQRALGYFPVVALTLAWLSSGDERDYYIFRHGFAIWEDACEEPLAAIAAHLGITAERCRQIRKHLFGELADFLQTIETDGPCPYDCLDGNVQSVVNEAEGTAFTADFIRFILGSSYPELTVIGDAEVSFLVKLKGGTDDAFVAAIPQGPAQEADFNAFLDGIEAKNVEKRTEVQYYPLPDSSPQARNLAATLARLRYGWTEEGGQLVIPTNADKNRSDIMENIIRDAGRPLSMEEIIKEYARRYPDRTTDPAKIRGNMQVNPCIVPIGRSGVYSLAEWRDGSARGGTIRSFVRECLDSSETHIVPTQEVFDYVRRFRPTSSNENIVTNLMLETEKSFRVIWKGDISYLSYSTEPIPEGYRQLTRTVTERRSFEESIALVDRFISRNGYMPKVCDDPEQTRLARFLTTQRSLRRRGLLTQEEISEFNRIESKANGGCVQLELF